MCVFVVVFMCVKSKVCMIKHGAQVPYLLCICLECKAVIVLPTITHNYGNYPCGNNKYWKYFVCRSNTNIFNSK